MKDRLPTMPFFVGDYLGSIDVRLMTLAERGAYVHLLCLNWQAGRLPKDAKKLARLLDCSLEEFQQIWEGIRHRFEEDSQGQIYSQRVEAIKRQSVERRRKMALAGSKGGRTTQAKRKGSSQASSEASSQASSEASSQAPSEASSQAPREASRQDPSEASSEAPRETLSRASTKEQPPILPTPIKDSSSTNTKKSNKTPPLPPSSGEPDANQEACRRVFNHWRGQHNLVRHRFLNRQMQRGIHARLEEGRTVQDLCRAISRYEELCGQKCAPGHNQWSLNELMSRGSGIWLDKLLDPNYPGILPRNGSNRPPPEWLVNKMRRAIFRARRRLVGAHDVTEQRFLRQVAVCCGELGVTFTEELFNAAAEAMTLAVATGGDNTVPEGVERRSIR